MTDTEHPLTIEWWLEVNRQHLMEHGSLMPAVLMGIDKMHFFSALVTGDTKEEFHAMMGAVITVGLCAGFEIFTCNDAWLSSYGPDNPPPAEYVPPSEDPNRFEALVCHHVTLTENQMWTEKYERGPDGKPTSFSSYMPASEPTTGLFMDVVTQAQEGARIGLERFGEPMPPESVPRVIAQGGMHGVVLQSVGFPLPEDLKADRAGPGTAVDLSGLNEEETKAALDEMWAEKKWREDMSKEARKL